MRTSCARRASTPSRRPWCSTRRRLRRTFNIDSPCTLHARCPARALRPTRKTPLVILVKVCLHCVALQRFIWRPRHRLKSRGPRWGVAAGRVTARMATMNVSAQDEQDKWLAGARAAPSRPATRAERPPRWIRPTGVVGSPIFSVPFRGCRGLADFLAPTPSSRRSDQTDRYLPLTSTRCVEPGETVRFLHEARAGERPDPASPASPAKMSDPNPDR